MDRVFISTHIQTKTYLLTKTSVCVQTQIGVFVLAIHIIVPISLTGRKNDIFLLILFIKMSFFHYNIAKAIFAIILKGTECGRSEKSTVLRRILRLLYIAIKYKKISVTVCTAF